MRSIVEFLATAPRHRSRMMTRITSESQAAKRIEARLKREKELSTAYRKTLKILGENEV
ncbi:MAG: hypothetical protein K9N51_10240 [Candidatus Pacebacteria bacterium]|nr:hypothetical protein [Candidatus Paceibacterota bacterium]